MSPQKRRLEDLYVIGKEIQFDDGHGEPVKVWLRKLNPVENSTASRIGNAERARIRAAGADKSSDEYQALRLDVLDLGDGADPLIEQVVGDKIAEATLKSEAKVAAEEEWSKDNYIQGLWDTWRDGLREKLILDAEDAEALRVLHEIERFNEQAKAVAEAEIEEAKESYRNWPIEDLREKAMEIQLRFRANSAWLDEFHRAELLLGTFEEDRKTKYFDKIEEVRALPGPVLVRLLNEYGELSVDAIEGKGSEETSDSSTSPEQPEDQATGVSSGLEAASQ
jgi:hypothetical protein